jgi:hypothetical protein
MTTKKASASVDIIQVNHNEIRARILGRSPMICNAMSAKAQQQLLFPPPRKNAAAKAQTLKHDPYREFRDSTYVDLNDDAPTLITQLSAAFKGAMKSAALDLPGATKSVIGRNTWVNGERIHIYGIPEMMMAVTRSADMARTPDVRTRAILPEWACEVSVTFVDPILKQEAVINLLANAGMMAGVGDWRVGKGSGSYGQFSLVSSDNEDWHRIVEQGGRDVQITAMENPHPYDDETAKLLAWYDQEARSRGFDTAKEVA